MKYNVTVNGKKYEVMIEQGSGNEGTAKVVSNTATVAGNPAVNNQSTVGGEAVSAPMPGTILKIKIQEGQAVKKGDVLFILEAMKMENEIMAGRDAVVVKILVSNGTTVKTGDNLALLK